MEVFWNASLPSTTWIVICWVGVGTFASAKSAWMFAFSRSSWPPLWGFLMTVMLARPAARVAVEGTRVAELPGAPRGLDQVARHQGRRKDDPVRVGEGDREHDRRGIDVQVRRVEGHLELELVGRVRPEDDLRRTGVLADGVDDQARAVVRVVAVDQAVAIVVDLVGADLLLLAGQRATVAVEGVAVVTFLAVARLNDPVAAIADWLPSSHCSVCGGCWSILPSPQTLGWQFVLQWMRHQRRTSEPDFAMDSGPGTLRAYSGRSVVVNREVPGGAATSIDFERWGTRSPVPSAPGPGASEFESHRDTGHCSARRCPTKYE